MTKFYVVRHGQTDFNQKHLLQGRTNIPLNETGIEQAEKMNILLSSVEFEAIYYSPLLRAKETADIIHKNHQNSQYVECAEIIERDFGKYEGKTRDTKPAYYGLWNYNLESKNINGGESMAEIKKRVYPFLDSLIRKYPDKNVCLVCHGGVALIIREYFEGTPEGQDLLDFKPIPNGEVAVFEK